MSFFLAPLARYALGAGLIAALAVAGYFYVAHLRARAEQAEFRASVAEDQRDKAIEVNAANARALGEIRRAHEAELAAVAADRDAALRRAGRVRIIREDVVRAPDSEDGPVALVLRRALDGLRAE